MELINDDILEWACARNLVKGSDAKSQSLKLVSEVGELCDSILKNDVAGIKDGIGDSIVVLTILAAQNGLTLRECMVAAYYEIKDRKGVMFNGTFIKSTDARFDDALKQLAKQITE